LSFTLLNFYQISRCLNIYNTAKLSHLDLKIFNSINTVKIIQKYDIKWSNIETIKACIRSNYITTNYSIIALMCKIINR